MNRKDANLQNDNPIIENKDKLDGKLNSEMRQKKLKTIKYKVESGKLHIESFITHLKFLEEHIKVEILNRSVVCEGIVRQLSTPREACLICIQPKDIT